MLKYKKLHPDAKITRGSDRAAGLDLYAIEDDGLYLEDGQTEKHRTGIAVEIPVGFVGLIRDRSSLGAKGIIVSGGVIDSDYRGEIFVCLTLIDGRTEHKIKKGDKIAQLLILPYSHLIPEEVQELSDTKRGSDGFGSTGK